MERDAATDVLKLLGLARRSGAVATGTERVRQALASSTAKLVLIARDASPVQLKKIEAIIRRAAVPTAVLGDRVDLGAAVGGPPLSAVAVTNARLAQEMLRRLAQTAPADS